MAHIDDYLEEKRRDLDRVPVNKLAEELAAGALLVDMRPLENRESEGTIPDAVVIDSNVLLWRLSPTSEARSVDVAPDQRVILFCNEGYASSVAASQLRELGVEGATDLIGGYRAWKATQHSD